MSHIPIDRFRHGMVPSADLPFNAMMTSLNDKRFSTLRLVKFDKTTKNAISSNLLIDRTGVNKHTEAIIDLVNVEGAYDLSIPIRNLSGGNQQKFVVGRELLKKHELLLAGHPTRGLDINAIDNIYKNIIKDSKTSPVVLYSLEINELIAVADRLLVFYEGRIIAEVDPRDSKQVKKLPYLMVGEK
jgi:simple sugar transport system ATP-binding protein